MKRSLKLCGKLADLKFGTVVNEYKTIYLEKVFETKDFRTIHVAIVFFSKVVKLLLSFKFGQMWRLYVISTKPY